MLILSACSFNKTPADINENLVSQIAKELIETQDSARLEGVTPQIQSSLKDHAEDGITFEVGASQAGPETGIQFYTKEDHKLFLSLGLDLNASKNGYILVACLILNNREFSNGQARMGF